jgi:hypothetical protein
MAKLIDIYVQMMAHSGTHKIISRHTPTSEIVYQKPMQLKKNRLINVIRDKSLKCNYGLAAMNMSSHLPVKAFVNGNWCPFHVHS